jgi:hypothetical protein
LNSELGTSSWEVPAIATYQRSVILAVMRDVRGIKIKVKGIEEKVRDSEFESTEDAAMG